MLGCCNEDHSRARRGISRFGGKFVWVELRIVPGVVANQRAKRAPPLVLSHVTWQEDRLNRTPGQQGSEAIRGQSKKKNEID